MNSFTTCIADHGMAPIGLLQLAFSAFTAVLFIQSGLDKVLNWSSEKAYYTKHFSNSILKSQVPVLMPVITLMELAAGFLSAAGFLQVLLSGNATLGTAGMLFAAAALTMLFFGQRVAKDYGGAAVLVPYFLMAAGGLYVYLIG